MTTETKFDISLVSELALRGGSPLIEANRVGCDVTGFDISPMAAWIVREEIERLDVGAYQDEAGRLLGKLRAEIGDLYLTDMPTMHLLIDHTRIREYRVR